MPATVDEYIMTSSYRRAFTQYAYALKRLHELHQAFTMIISPASGAGVDYRQNASPLFTLPAT